MSIVLRQDHEPLHFHEIQENNELIAIAKKAPVRVNIILVRGKRTLLKHRSICSRNYSWFSYKHFNFYRQTPELRTELLLLGVEISTMHL